VGRQGLVGNRRIESWRVLVLRRDQVVTLGLWGAERGTSDNKSYVNYGRGEQMLHNCYKIGEELG
jgi:hypothetical protein